MIGASEINCGEQSVSAKPEEVGRLPRLLVLTDRRQVAASIIDVVAAAVTAGARAVVLREKELPYAERCALVAQMAPVVHEAGGVLLSAGSHLSGADGVHQPSTGGPLEPGASITGRSCHGVEEVRAAEDDGIDYVTVSPINTSVSKPGYGPALGIEGLASVTASTTLPVYALGGIDGSEAATACRAAGAYGVAVMGAIMRARNPGPLVAELLAAVEQNPT